jgi:hypothetical protein
MVCGFPRDLRAKARPFGPDCNRNATYCQESCAGARSAPFDAWTRCADLPAARLRLSHIWWYFVLQSSMLEATRRRIMAAIGIVGLNMRGAAARRLAFALAVCAVGTASLLRDAWPKAMHWPFIDLHAAFGALLCLMVVAQFHAENLRAVALSGLSLHAFCRGLTRLVFLELYVLFGVNELVHWAATLWNKGLHGGAQPAVLPSPESLRDYLAYGVVALIIIRLLEAWMTHRSPTTSTTKESAISAGRGRGCSAVAAGAGPKSAVTR